MDKKEGKRKKEKKNWSKVTRENISVLFFSRYSYKIPLKSERMTGNVNYSFFFLLAFFFSLSDPEKTSFDNHGKKGRIRKEKTGGGEESFTR